MNFKITFNSLDEFYKECDIQEPTGDTRQYQDMVERDEKSFVGLSLSEIKQYKYFYKEGLDKLKEIDLEESIGGSRKKYKWDDQDGDELSMERLTESLPCLSKRVKTHGDSGGKFVNLHINIGENCGVDYEDMLTKSYTAIQIVDYLENNGYKVTIIAMTDVVNLGSYNDERVDHLHTEVVLKKPEEPLIKSLLLTCISPWMLRYHMFKFWTAKFVCNYGLGRSERMYYKDDKHNLYINTGECLSKREAEDKIKYFRSIFKSEDSE